MQNHFCLTIKFKIMKKILIVFVVAIFVIFSSCEKNEDLTSVTDQDVASIQMSEEVIPGQYIVYFEGSGLKSAYKDKTLADRAVVEKAARIFESADIEFANPEFVYSVAVEGVAVKMSETDAAKLATVSGVKGVWADKMVTLAKPTSVPVTQPVEVTPPGITRVGGGATYTGTHKAWIIDTGIDYSHPDLNVNTTLAKTYVARTSSADDDNGHGTHCAGIVAAIDNEIGVVGVAAGAQVVPVKVLDKRGSGAYSQIIAGVDYVRANATAGDAANMSLGGGVYEPIDLAVVALGESGVYVALAAGNESDDANNHSPARANGTNIYTVSAMSYSGDNWASFSNYGNPPIDFCAPGLYIFSTYKGDSYTTMSGTSMAAPHVCGLLLATNGNVSTDGTVNGDPDGNPDEIAHM